MVSVDGFLAFDSKLISFKTYLFEPKSIKESKRVLDCELFIKKLEFLKAE